MSDDLTNHHAGVLSRLAAFAETLTAEGAKHANAYANGFYGVGGAKSSLPTDPNQITDQQAFALRVAIETNAVRNGDAPYYRTRR